jgi:hypothetical protein
MCPQRWIVAMSDTYLDVPAVAAEATIRPTDRLISLLYGVGIIGAALGSFLMWMFFLGWVAFRIIW